MGRHHCKSIWLKRQGLDVNVFGVEMKSTRVKIPFDVLEKLETGKCKLAWLHLGNEIELFSNLFWPFLEEGMTREKPERTAPPLFNTNRILRTNHRVSPVSVQKDLSTIYKHRFDICFCVSWRWLGFFLFSWIDVCVLFMDSARKANLPLERKRSGLSLWACNYFVHRRLPSAEFV